MPDGQLEISKARGTLGKVTMLDEELKLCEGYRL